MELKETEKRLLEAVSHIVENDGFTKIGVNRIANQAGCDKVLIYRYFGGLDGLLVEWAKRHDYYSFAYSAFIDTIKRTEDGDIRQIVKDVLMCQLNYLKDNVLMQELLVWELLLSKVSSKNVSVSVINCRRNLISFWIRAAITICLSP